MAAIYHEGWSIAILLWIVNNLYNHGENGVAFKASRSLCIRVALWVNKDWVFPGVAPRNPSVSHADRTTLMEVFCPASPSMILLTLQMRRVMMRLMASQGLLGPLATVEATMGARDSTMTAPSNTWKIRIKYVKLLLFPIGLHGKLIHVCMHKGEMLYFCFFSEWNEEISFTYRPEW